jgi:hypothetical protein
MLKSSLAICMLLGQTLASEELFLNDHSVNHMTLKDQVSILAANDQVDVDENKPQTVRGGACQYVAGYQIYDLSQLERSLAKKQELAKKQPIHSEDDVNEETNTAFQYKICLPQWRLLKDRDMQIGGCTSSKSNDKSKKATAFMSKYDKDDDKSIKDRDCEYSFEEPKFQAILEPEDTEENIKYKGYTLTYTSD